MSEYNEAIKNLCKAFDCLEREGWIGAMESEHDAECNHYRSIARECVKIIKAHWKPGP